MTLKNVVSSKTRLPIFCKRNHNAMKQHKFVHIGDIT